MNFRTHDLSEEQILQGMVLSPSQVQVLENRLAQIATDILTYPASSTDATYFERLNFARGQMQEVQSMLNTSEEAKQQLQQLNQQPKE